MMNQPFQPFNRECLSDAVAAKIKELVASGKYKKGDKLPSETELMRLFGVGRSSIREAVRLLSNSGLVRVQQGVGTFIEHMDGIAEPLHQRLTRANYDDLLEVRRLLELKIAEKAALNRTEEDIVNMTSHLKKRIEAAENNLKADCIAADIDFHISIAMAAKNEILADLYKTIAAKLKQTFTERTESVAIFVARQQMHEALLQSIIDQDAKQAWLWASKITGQAH